jgi:hypothetical protein
MAKLWQDNNTLFCGVNKNNGVSDFCLSDVHTATKPVNENLRADFCCRTDTGY